MYERERHERLHHVDGKHLSYYCYCWNMFNLDESRVSIIAAVSSIQSSRQMETPIGAKRFPALVTASSRVNAPVSNS